MSTQDSNWTTVIKPHNKLWEIDFKEIWRYKDLWAMYIKRDITTMYKQTILGPLWFLIQPAITTIMYMVVFGGIAGIPTDGIPQPLFYLAGICMWQYFADCLNKTSATFLGNAGVFGKVYFPRVIVPLSVVASNLVKFGVQLFLFLAVYVYYIIQGTNAAPNITILLFPVLVFMLAGFGLGFGMIVSSLTTKYRDLTILFSFVVQLWMYGTPIIYPLSTITNEKLLLAMKLNPITAIVETFKYSTLSAGTFSWYMLGYSFCFMVVVFFIGLIMFNKQQRSFMDTV
ncbi:MAG: ABC transporter permease [Paludibacteraceae bacterium]|nr:ABC transporter permease [Paludibacteraceae bacterium]